MFIAIISAYLIGVIVSFILEYNLERITESDKADCLKYASCVCWLSWISVVTSWIDYCNIEEE